MTPLITNDAVVLGILMCILAAVFITAGSETPFWKKLYTFIPPLLLCYFVPSIFSTAGVYSGDASRLYAVASQYLLPTSLVLLTISIDLKGIARLGPKALIMFLGGTVGIILGGPLAVLVVSLFSPELVGAIVGSQANVGGAASAPVVASAFHPALAPVGVLLAVLGYALGTYGGWLCGQLMRVVAPQWGRDAAGRHFSRRPCVR